MKQLALGIVAGLLAYGVVVTGSEPAKTNNPAEPPPKKASASPADQAFAVAQEALKKADYPAGRRLFGEFAGKFPADARVPEAQFLKGLCELKGGPQGAALTTWKALLAFHPRTEAAAQALEQMLVLAEQQKHDGEQAALRRRLLEDFPNHAATVRLMVRDGEAKAARNDFDGAQADYRKVEAGLDAVQKKRLRELILLADGQRPSAGTPAECAEDELKRAHELDALGNHAEAERLYRRIRACYPAEPLVAEATFQQGLALVQQEKFIEAIAQWNELLRLPGTNQWKEVAALEIGRTLVALPRFCVHPERCMG